MTMRLKIDTVEVNANDVKADDYIMFGNELYRVFNTVSTPADAAIPQTSLILITDNRKGESYERTVRVHLHPQHPVTVVQAIGSLRVGLPI